jgi:hypothetical protein
MDTEAELQERAPSMAVARVKALRDKSGGFINPFNPIAKFTDVLKFIMFSKDSSGIPSQEVCFLSNRPLRDPGARSDSPSQAPSMAT